MQYNEIIFLKVGYFISKYDMNYDYYIDRQTDNIHSYLKFKHESKDFNLFNGNYSCRINLESLDLDQSASIYSNAIQIELSKKSKILFLRCYYKNFFDLKLIQVIIHQLVVSCFQRCLEIK